MGLLTLYGLEYVISTNEQGVSLKVHAEMVKFQIKQFDLGGSPFPLEHQLLKEVGRLFRVSTGLAGLK
jgi:hypothetical protein